MNIITKRSRFGLLAVTAIALAGCGSSGSDTPDEGMGVLNLSVSDGGIEATKVCIKFDGVQLKKADEGEPISIDFNDPGFDGPEIVNLLANQGANSQQITSAQVPAGNYQWIRLIVDASSGNDAGSADSSPDSDECLADDGSYVLTESGLYSLFIPSGEQSGLKLIKDITIPVNSSGNYTAEWDLGKSFIAPPGLAPDVLMKPVVKLVRNNEVGTLNGTVADELVDPAVCDLESDIAPSVYVYDDDENRENPVNGDDQSIEPVATGLVDQEMQGMPYTYEIGFLLAGNYEVAFTCDGETFIPEAGKEATIAIGAVETVNFVSNDLPEAE